MTTSIKLSYNQFEQYIKNMNTKIVFNNGIANKLTSIFHLNQYNTNSYELDQLKSQLEIHGINYKISGSFAELLYQTAKSKNISPTEYFKNETFTIEWLKDTYDLLNQTNTNIKYTLKTNKREPPFKL